MPTVTGAPATLENTARDILAGLGNDSPSASQLAAMEAWITAEGSFGGKGSYSNNPLNVSINNVKASISAGFLPPTFQYSVPDPTQNGGNPVVQFPDLTSGIIANIAALKQSFASGIRGLLSAPQDITTGTLSQAVSASHWGTEPFGTVTGNPGQVGGSGGGIGVTSGGQTAGGNTAGSSCTPPSSALDLVGQLNYLNCQLTQEAAAVLPRIAAYLVGALLVIIGVAIFLVDDIKVGPVSLKDSAERVAK